MTAGIVAACALPLVYMHVDFAAFGSLPPLLSAQDVFYLQTHFPHARLLNHWNFGGTLIFRNRGAIPVFVDGRAATAYPDSLLLDYFKLGRSEVIEADWDAVLEKYQIKMALWVKPHGKRCGSFSSAREAGKKHIRGRVCEHLRQAIMGYGAAADVRAACNVRL